MFSRSGPWIGRITGLITFPEPRWLETWFGDMSHLDKSTHTKSNSCALLTIGRYAKGK